MVENIFYSKVFAWKLSWRDLADGSLARACLTAACIACLLSFPVFASTPVLTLKSAPNLKKVTVFTHGDSRFAQLNADGSITGSAVNVLACAMPRLGLSYELAILPLSRATYVVDMLEDAIWFPASHTGDSERMNRIVGPIDDETVLWYQLASNTADPNTEAFRRSARVTMYTGSALEQELRDNGFNVFDGSADHNRLIYMLMSDEIDALLAIDFRRALTPETFLLVEKRLRTTPLRSAPVSFQSSVALAKKHPDFITEFRKTALDCTTNGLGE
jgi:hypothetical protein